MIIMIIYKILINRAFIHNELSGNLKLNLQNNANLFLCN